MMRESAEELRSSSKGTGTVSFHLLSSRSRPLLDEPCVYCGIRHLYGECQYARMLIEEQSAGDPGGKP